MNLSHSAPKLRIHHLSLNIDGIPKKAHLLKKKDKEKYESVKNDYLLLSSNRKTKKETIRKIKTEYAKKIKSKGGLIKPHKEGNLTSQLIKLTPIKSGVNGTKQNLEREGNDCLSTMVTNKTRNKVEFTNEQQETPTLKPKKFIFDEDELKAFRINNENETMSDSCNIGNTELELKNGSNDICSSMSFSPFQNEKEKKSIKKTTTVATRITDFFPTRKQVRLNDFPLFAEKKNFPLNSNLNINVNFNQKGIIKESESKTNPFKKLLFKIAKQGSTEENDDEKNNVTPKRSILHESSGDKLEETEAKSSNTLEEEHTILSNSSQRRDGRSMHELKLKQVKKLRRNFEDFKKELELSEGNISFGEESKKKILDD